MRRVRQISYGFLEENTVILPVAFDNLQELAEKNGWPLIPYTEISRMRHLKIFQGIDVEVETKTKKGFTIFRDGEAVIVYDEKLALDDRNFTILHEFGHIYLRHTGIGILGMDNDSRIMKIQESEADAFAAEIMAPIPVLKKCRFKSFSDIESFGLIYGERAKLQFAEMQEALKDESTLFEERIAEKYKELIRIGVAKNRKDVFKKLKPALVVLTIGFLLATSFATYNAVDGMTTVYVTDTGHRYHKEGCTELRQSKTETTKGQAKKEKYTPCDKCKP